MMKKLTIILSAMLLVGISATALAEKPESPGNSENACKPEKPAKPEKSAKPTKAALMHCGCSDDGMGLKWNYLVVSSKSKGHRKHQAGDVVECYVQDGDLQTLVGTYTRDESDCTVSADFPLHQVEWCGESAPIEGDSCGSEYIAPPE